MCRARAHAVRCGRADGDGRLGTRLAAAACVLLLSSVTPPMRSSSCTAAARCYAARPAAHASSRRFSRAKVLPS